MSFQSAALLLAILALPAAGAAPAGNAVAGRDKVENERCLECHGNSGDGQGLSTGAGGKFARLFGQQPEYIVKQVQDFRHGRRKNDFMEMMARGISDTDLADIADFLGTQAATPGDATTSSASPAAQQLYLHGDDRRQLPACASCHGADARGVAQAGPRLAGQGVRYLEQQLENWRNGSRRNSNAGVMNRYSAELSNSEIAELSRYLSGL